MAHFEGTIIITDPVYVSLENDLNDKSGFNFESKTAPKSFKNYMIEDNYWGDGIWKIKDKKSKKVLDSYETVSGFTGVFYEKDVLNYNPNFFKMNYKHVKLNDFNGNIESHIDEDRAMRIWSSNGNINFIIE